MDASIVPDGSTAVRVQSVDNKPREILFANNQVVMTIGTHFLCSFLCRSNFARTPNTNTHTHYAGKQSNSFFPKENAGCSEHCAKHFFEQTLHTGSVPANQRQVEFAHTHTQTNHGALGRILERNATYFAAFHLSLWRLLVVIGCECDGSTEVAECFSDARSCSSAQC